MLTLDDHGGEGVGEVLTLADKGGRVGLDNRDKDNYNRNDTKKNISSFTFIKEKIYSIRYNNLSNFFFLFVFRINPSTYLYQTFLF